MAEQTPNLGLPYLGSDDTLKETTAVAESSALAIENELVRLDERITNENTSVIASGTGSTKSFKVTRKWDGKNAGDNHGLPGTFNYNPSGTGYFTIVSKNDAGEHEIAYHQLLEDKYGLPDVPGFGSARTTCIVSVTDSSGKTWTTTGVDTTFYGLDDDGSDHSGHVHFQNTGFSYGDDSGARETHVPAPTVPDEEYTFEVIFLGELFEPEEEDKPEITQRVPWNLGANGFDITCKIKGYKINTDYDHTKENNTPGTIRNFMSGTEATGGFSYNQQYWYLNPWPAGASQNNDPFYPDLELEQMRWTSFQEALQTPSRKNSGVRSAKGSILLWSANSMHKDYPTEMYENVRVEFYLSARSSQGWISFNWRRADDLLNTFPGGVGNDIPENVRDNEMVRIVFIPDGAR